MKTFSKYDPEQGRTYPITVDGETRWITSDDKHTIFNDWRCMGHAEFAARLGETTSTHTRIFDIYESPRNRQNSSDYVLRTDGCGIDDHLKLVASPLSFSEVCAQYKADTRWELLKR